MNRRAIGNLRRKKGYRILLITFIILCLLSIIPSNTSATDTDTEIEQDPVRQIVTADVVAVNLPTEGQPVIAEAKVGPGDLRSVFFKGTVECVSGLAGKNLKQVIVFLHADVIAEEHGWSAMVNPPMISFPYVSGHVVQTRDISVNVLAPFRAKYTETPIPVIVSGEWMTMPVSISGQVDAHQAEVGIVVAQFPDLLLDSYDVLIQDSPGKITDFELQILNRGNDYDDFIVEFVNDLSLNDAGWALELRGPTTVEDIPSWGVKNITIRVYSPQKFTPYKNQVTEIIVKITSDSAPGTPYEKFGTKDFSFFLYERGMYLPPEQTICSVTFLIIIIVVALWWRKRKYREIDRPFKKGKKTGQEDETELEEEKSSI